MGRAAARDRREPLGRLVRFEATDGVTLAGLLFEPHVAKGVILWLHARTNLLARVFNDHRLAFFAFNNRGAQYVRRAGRVLPFIESVDDSSGDIRVRAAD